MTSDILVSTDNGGVYSLVLSDLSTSFDTKDHISCNGLSECYNTHGIVLKSSKSYLSVRYQSVGITGIK